MLEDSFDLIEDVFDELDADDLIQFASLADADMALAGEKLAAGINSLIGFDKNIKWSELYMLEDSFDLIEDVFDELDTTALSEFGSLADKDLGSLGSSLGAMFKSFTEFGTAETIAALDITEDVFDYLEDALDELNMNQLTEFGSADFSKMEENSKGLFAGVNELSKLNALDLSGLENTFNSLKAALDELNMYQLTEFGNADFSKIEANSKLLFAGVSELSKLNTTDLSGLENTFNLLRHSMYTLDKDQLTEFGNADFSKMEENSKFLFAGVTELSKLNALDLSSLENTFDLLEDAMDELDMDDLADFLELDTTKLANIVNSALGGGASGGATATKESTLTEVSGLLKELIAKVDQPVQINIGGRAVDEIEKQTSLRKTYNTKMDSGYGTFG